MTDPVGDLRDLLDSLDVIARKTERVAAIGERNRFGLLYVHAALAMFIAPLFAFWGDVSGLAGPSWAVLRVMPGMPWSFAALLLLGGLALTFGVAGRARRLILPGLLLILGWYSAVSMSFALAVVIWFESGKVGPVPALYAPFVYLHLSIIMFVHLRTVLQERKTTT